MKWIDKKGVIVACTGASGAWYSYELLVQLKELEIPSHLIVSRSFVLMLQHEKSYALSDLHQLATWVHGYKDVATTIASGSYPIQGMIIAPCSMQTLAQVATGVGDNLITRAAHVTLKERRPLILLPRESPLHLGHLEQMRHITLMGGIIAPEAPAFYTGITTLREMVNQTVARLLGLLGLSSPHLIQWEAK